MYNTTWACPPRWGPWRNAGRGVWGTRRVLILSTVTEVRDIADMEETLATRAGHEAVTHEAEALLKAQGCETMALSTEACAICDHCAYPAGPCRHPDKMYPCVESHGILVTAIAEQLAWSSSTAIWSPGTPWCFINRRGGCGHRSAVRRV